MTTLVGCAGTPDPEPLRLGQLASAATALTNASAFPNASGRVSTYNTTGKLSLKGPFFQSLGTNGRTCGTCHRPEDGFSLTPAHIQAVFDATGGLDPLFRPVDATNNPNADVSTVAARQAAYSLFRTRGVVRFTFPVPAQAQFQLLFADDPHGNDANAGVTVFRRPLPATGVAFLSTVMWDGRGLHPDDPATGGLSGALRAQANDAHVGHAQATAGLSLAQQTSIVDLELAIFTAQSYDNAAGSLSGNGGLGGAKHLAAQSGAIGPFTIYSAWATTGKKPAAAARAAIRRGEDLFNTLPMTLSGVRGLNTDAQPVVTGTCRTCHEVANVGSQATFSTFDIGVAAASRRPADSPLYTFVNSATGESISLTDPGRAVVTGQWSDMGRFKSPSLRGLASRAPYFHDGTAATIEDVIEFYNGRFQMQLSPANKADLAAFLKAL